MLNQFLSQALVFDAYQDVVVEIKLADNVSDFSVLQSLNSPLVEVVLTQCENQRTSLIVRALPFLTLSLISSSTVSPHQFDGHSLKRTAGQGFRVYSQMSTAPKVCAEELRKGVTFKLEPNDEFTLRSIEGSRFEVLPLENDIRIIQGPRPLMKARALLSRSYDYGKESEMLAVHISELDIVSRELTHYIASEMGRLHPGLSAESVSLGHQIQEKRQWLQREYSRTIERRSLTHGANEDYVSCNPKQNSDYGRSIRMVECYKLLAPNEVTLLVEQMVDDST